MAATIRVLLLMLAGPDHHVEPVVEQQCDHRRRRRGIIGQIAVGHDVDIGIDVGEHSADDVALALHPLGADLGPRSARQLDRAVAAIVVIDVDRRARQHGAEPLDRAHDRGFLVVTRQQDGNAQRMLDGH